MAAKVVRWIISNAPADLRASEMLVAVMLAEHAKEDGSHAYPSVATLVDETRLGERTVRLALKELVRLEVIEVECPATNKYPTMYRFPSYRGADAAPPEVQEVPPVDDALGVQKTTMGVQELHLGVHKTTLGGAELAPKPSEEPPVEPPVEPSERSAPAPLKPKRKKPAMPLPEGWDQEQEFQGSGGLYEWARRELGMSTERVDFETDKFLDYWRGEGVAKADWLATWRNWMRRSQEGFRRRA